MSIHSLRLSLGELLRDWWAAMAAAFSTYGFLLAAQPPRESAESAYFFLFPCLLWFYFRPGLRKVAVAFFLAGCAYHVALVGWIRHVTPSGMAGAAFLLALYNLPWFLLARRLLPGALEAGFAERLFTMSALSAAWVAIEWARCQFTLGFPWCPLSVTQWERPAILQTLPWTGAWSVSFFLVFFNLSLASYVHHLLVRRRKRTGGVLSSLCPDLYAGILLLTVMVSPFFLADHRGTEGDSLKVKVGVCQPYLKNKWEGDNAALHKDVLRRQTRFLSLMTPDLIVWPEASTPYSINRDPIWVEELAREGGVPLLVGAVVSEEEVSYNTISRVSPEQGLSPEAYSKRVLVPFGEYVPYPFRWIPGLRRMVGPVGSFGSGKDPFSFTLEDGRGNPYQVGSLVCYEDIFPELVRESVRHGADFLFVTTNDAWFGEEGCPYQHAAHSVLRAVENGIPVLRCGNAGWSGWIDPRGYRRSVLVDENGSIFFEGASILEMEFSGSKEVPRKGYPDFFIWFCIGFTLWTLYRLRKSPVYSSL